ncbi:MAG: PAS domain-containing protein [Gammaproteobacteria bacterium]|nr:MAG: PAS domain-containing protein [Gammaproteobacteria bacterium]
MLPDMCPSPPADTRPEDVPEDAWLDVIRQMERTYAELVQHQMELEDKNQALEEAYHFISSVLAAMSDWVVVCETDGTIRQINRAFSELTGLASGQVIGQPLSGLLLPSSPTEPDTLWRQARVGPVSEAELHLKGRYGRVAMSVNCACQKDARGRPLAYVLVGRPIGELKRAYDELSRSLAELKLAQDQLLNAEKMASLGRVVAGVAHELNNPISFIYGNTHVLLKYAERMQAYMEAAAPHLDTPDMRALADELQVQRILKDLPSLLSGMMEGVERVRDIVSDLRHFSTGQNQAGKPFDIIRLIHTAVRWVFKGADAEIKLEVPDRLMVRGHAGRIHQVLMNLMSNALNAIASSPEKRVIVRAWTEPTSHEAVIEVRDTGPGIPPEHLDKIFEPFFTTKPVGEGTGLGLSLSYSFVVESGGDLRAGNSDQGGAIFTLTLPLSETRDGGTP